MKNLQAAWRMKYDSFRQRVLLIFTGAPLERSENASYFAQNIDRACYFCALGVK